MSELDTEAKEFIKTLLTIFLDYAKGVIETNTGEEMSPSLICFHVEEDGEVTLTTVDFGGIPKGEWPGAILHFCVKYEAQSYIFLTEAWSTVPTADEKEATAILLAMQHSSLEELDVPKKEVVMAAYTGPGGNWAGFMEIKEGRVLGERWFPGLEEGEEVEVDFKFEGRLTGLVPQFEDLPTEDDA